MVSRKLPLPGLSVVQSQPAPASGIDFSGRGWNAIQSRNRLGRCRQDRSLRLGNGTFEARRGRIFPNAARRLSKKPHRPLFGPRSCRSSHAWRVSSITCWFSRLGSAGDLGVIANMRGGSQSTGVKSRIANVLSNSQTASLLRHRNPAKSQALVAAATLLQCSSTKYAKNDGRMTQPFSEWIRAQKGG